jgi:hypothetical protein
MNSAKENKVFFYALATILATSALIAKVSVLIAGVTA